MELSNTEDEYGIIAKAFHWLIAVLIIGLIPVGLFMTGMENSPLKFEIYALHKSFGLLVFFLGVGRLVWRFISPPPDHLETHASWERTLAAAAHFWLYVCIIGMPLSGWLMSSAAEFPVPFFGINLPYLIGKDQDLAEFFGEAHEILAYTLLFILALHAAGALKHHIIDKDDTLQRMTFKSPGFLIPAVIVLIMGASYAASSYFVIFGEDRQVEGEDKAGERAAKDEEKRLKKENKAREKCAKKPERCEGDALALPVPPTGMATLPSNGWAIIPAISKLSFQANLYNTPFTGELKDFTGEIIFNPADLSTAKADITIPLTTVTTGDSGRDESILGAEWFDTANHPTARFVADTFESADAGNYVAIGELTIRGVTLPLIIPFTLNIENNTAHMKATVTLNRLSYGMGVEQYADEATVGHDVTVIIDLKASQNP